MMRALWPAVKCFRVELLHSAGPRDRAGSALSATATVDELSSLPDDRTSPLQVTGAALQTARDRPATIDLAHQRAIIWVAFRPGGAHAFLDAVPGDRNQLVPLDALWGRDGATVRERLLAAAEPVAALHAVQAFLAERAVRAPEPDQALTLAARALHGGASVAEVSDRLGWTPRRLGRWFTARTGVTPKRYARVRRFQRLLAAVTAGGSYGRDVDWALLAVDCGYHDQAHMIHDFGDLGGTSPTRYAPRSAAEPNHMPLPG
jgi:AraC-like DNA-binding protein